MYSGILIIDKPTGLTSHDVVARVRRIFRTKKVGHAGTLDPDASGVLVLCLGDATRVLEYLTADEKVYTGEVVFGLGTDTDDASGTVIREGDAQFLTSSKVEEAARQFLGDIEQRPPQYSAVHVGGRRAYELARQGVEVDIPTRMVTVRSFDVYDFQPGKIARAKFRIHCGKGTYIRSLCRDIGEHLAVPAHMGELRRVRSGKFYIEDAVTLSNLEEMESPYSVLVDVVQGLSMPKFTLSDELCVRLSHGQTILIGEEGRNFTHGQIAAVIAQDGDLAAIVEKRPNEGSGPEALWKPKKVFWKREAP